MSLSRDTRRLLGLVATAVAVALLWWAQGAGDDGGAPERADATPTTSYSGDISPTPTPTGPSATATGAAPTGIDPDSGLPWVDLGDLPPEAKETLALIDSGGPFPYPDHDGKVFENREEILPDQPEGYYREYTVETPGSDDRGARRIVTGADGEFYWTQDHYTSFERIAA